MKSFVTGGAGGVVARALDPTTASGAMETTAHTRSRFSHVTLPS